MEYLKAFLVGGLFCVVGQILIDKTKLTPARILVAYVAAGVILGAKYGASQMPQAWIEKTRFPSGTCLTFTKGIDIRDYAEKITDIIVEG